VMNQKLLLMLNWFSITSLSKPNPESFVYEFTYCSVYAVRRVPDKRTHNAGVRVVPLVGRESGHHKEGEGDQDVGCQHVPIEFRLCFEFPLKCLGYSSVNTYCSLEQSKMASSI
jgi:hypothetical protein